MEAKRQVKPKRHKKRKSRTQVSSDNDSEYEKEPSVSEELTQESRQPVSETPKLSTEAEISTAFTKFYMQRAAQEFAEDLDLVRGAEDFKDESLMILIGALQQGASGFSKEEQRRVVLAREEGKVERQRV